MSWGSYPRHNFFTMDKINYNIDDYFKNANDLQKTKGLHVLLWGGSGVGKTYCSMTFPGPIYMIDTDGGIVSNLKYFDKDIKVFECSEANTEQPKGKDTIEPFDVDPLVSIEKFDTVTKVLADLNPTGTVVIDTITDIWGWISTWLNHKTEKQTSKSGSEYMSRFAWGDANNRYDWIMKRLKGLQTNVVLLARAKTVFDSTGNVTAEQKPDAQKRTEYYMDYCIQMSKTISGGDLTRIANVTKSRGADLKNPRITDLSYDKIVSLGKQ